MTGQPLPNQRFSHTRPRLVLLLLVGMLGMHGLAGEHSTGATANATAMGMVMSRPNHTSVATDPIAVRSGTTPAANVATPPAEAPVLVSSGRSPGGMAVADLCLAVLTAALLLLLVVTRHTAARRTAGRAPRPLAPNGARPPPRTPDLVAELCVSRT